jgi:pimeloyl-ACP methyl ester carboxylesterase
MLEAGIGGNQHQLSGIEAQVSRRTVVCAYERAGVGESAPPSMTPRPVTEAVADADAFIAATKAKAPYVLVGHSAGAAITFMYAQAHPETVAGFVSMNPVPPARPWLLQARKVETKSEYRDELAFYRGENPESIDFAPTERMLRDPLPPKMPYAVMFDEDCEGDAAVCRRILPPLMRVTKSLASVGQRGRFVRAKGAGHNIYGTDPKLVYETIDEILKEATP